jgi:hypothetical protein
MSHGGTIHFIQQLRVNCLRYTAGSADGGLPLHLLTVSEQWKE